jgi:hypothetical protein
MKHGLAASMRADLAGDRSELEARTGERVAGQKENDGERNREDECVAAECLGPRARQL